jgi:hypothetical protein
MRPDTVHSKVTWTSILPVHILTSLVDETHTPGHQSTVQYTIVPGPHMHDTQRAMHKYSHPTADRLLECRVRPQPVVNLSGSQRERAS